MHPPAVRRALLGRRADFALIAVELRLLDRVGEPEAKAAEVEGQDIAEPEWDGLYPGGRVPRSHLCRHILILGETGSGNIASEILPAVTAPLDRQSPVGCMLVIDPKDELAGAIRRMAGPGVEVREIDPLADSIDLMAGPHSSTDDLVSSRVTTAANKTLRRPPTRTGSCSGADWRP